MKSIPELEHELKEAKETVRLAKVQCTGCGGKGWFSDSTYDRSGEDVSCDRCHGTGLPASRVAKIIREAFAPYRKPVGREPPAPVQGGEGER